MFWAACPRSNRIDSGASAVAGFGVTRAIATAAPARCPAHGPTAASSARWARSRQTMNVQRCWFLLLPECRPASRIALQVAASSGRSAKRRTTRLVAIAFQTGSAMDRSRLGRRRGCGSGERRRSPATAADASRPEGPPGRASGGRPAARRWPRTGPPDRRCASPASRPRPRPRWPGRADRPGRPQGTKRRRVDSPGPRTATSALRRRRRVSRLVPDPAHRRVTRGRPRRGARSGSPGPPRHHRRARAGPGPRSGRWPPSR